MKQKTKPKLLRITTVSISFFGLLRGQLRSMSEYFETHAVSAPGLELDNLGKEENTKVHPLPMERQPYPFKDLVSLMKMRKLIAHLKPDIVHTHTPKAGLLGMIAAWMNRVPIRLHTVAGIPWMESEGTKRKILQNMEKLTYRLATHVYSNSVALRAFILENNLLPESKISVIANGSSNGIDTSWFQRTADVEKKARELRSEWNVENGKVIIFVGRLVKDKGIEELLQAFAQLKQEGQSVKLVLVGPFEEERDPLSSAASQIIKKDPHVITTGFVKDVRPYLCAADLLAFPTYREGFPNVPMQAGALGLPSVVTDINGCNEIVQHGVNGLILPPKDATALHDAIHQLLTDEPLYERLSKNARPMITERFEQKLVWEGLLKEYRYRMQQKNIDV